MPLSHILMWKTELEWRALLMGPQQEEKWRSNGSLATEHAQQEVTLKMHINRAKEKVIDLMQSNTSQV